jgi:hypothetical protein
MVNFKNCREVDSPLLREVPRLSYSQFYNLHLANHYRLKRYSMGWYPVNHPRWGVTEPVRKSAPATIQCLLNMGLFDGTANARVVWKERTDGSAPEVWINELGKRVLDHIHENAGFYFDVATDQLELVPMVEEGCTWRACFYRQLWHMLVWLQPWRHEFLKSGDRNEKESLEDWLFYRSIDADNDAIQDIERFEKCII